ncbi:TEKT3 [Bugula neritina]|uniref:Tektin n=2 Tax=Bugula neritina TaxID=10212 RepID=A0A7J7JNZ3_BUGNE|nr:TEKT3 [Bugula neritina]
MAGYYSISPIMRSRSATPAYMDIWNGGGAGGQSIAPRISSPNISTSKMVTTSNTRTFYNPATQNLGKRFAPNDWHSSNAAHYSLSQRERSTAADVRADSWRAVKEMDNRTRNRQTENTKRLGERVQDIAFWKSELNNEIGAMQNEIANLSEYKRVLERAYADTANPLRLAEECLLHREKRQGIDMVHDGVEKNLTKEVEKIKNCQDKMRKMLEKAAIQLKLNRAAQHACECDSGDKHHAQGIDDKCHQLRNTSMGLGYYPGIENVDNTISTPETWVRFTQENIKRSQRERAASERLRGDIDSLLRFCANEMWTAFNGSNNAFNSRIAETVDARNKLQDQLAKTMAEIFDMEKNIELLRKAIADKEAPLKVAMTRLEERTHRMNMELCHDPAMTGLQEEVRELQQAIAYLKDKLKRAEMALSRLHRTKNTLQHDISVKENSLNVDQKTCMGMRKTFPMNNNVGPIFSMPVVC